MTERSQKKGAPRSEPSAQDCEDEHDHYDKKAGDN
jgi:hypothetical protein